MNEVTRGPVETTGNDPQICTLEGLHLVPVAEQYPGPFCTMIFSHMSVDGRHLTLSIVHEDDYWPHVVTQSAAAVRTAHCLAETLNENASARFDRVVA